MNAPEKKPGRIRWRAPWYRDLPPEPLPFAETLEIPQPEAAHECCHMHRTSSKYLALNTQSYAMGNVNGRIIQGQRYDLTDDVARMLIQAGYLRALNPWEQLEEEPTNAQ